MTNPLNQFMLAFNAGLEKLLAARVPAYYGFRLLSGINVAPTATVRGVAIRCFIPITHVGVYEQFTHWETREPETLDWLDGLSSTDVLLDVGAQIGQEALYAAKKPNGPRLIISFDADLLSAHVFANNIQLNELTERIHFYFTALADQTTSLEFSTPSGLYNLPQTLPHYPIHYRVGATTLDAICQAQHYHPTHLKMDVDGAEVAILRGSPQQLQTLQAALIEVGPATRTPTIALLAAQGLKLCHEIPVGNAQNLFFERTP